VSISPYDQKILEAFNALNETNGGQGASAAEVTQYMAEHKTLSAMDSVIDIADSMRDLQAKGHLGVRRTGS